MDTFEEEEVEPLTEIVTKINQTNATIESKTASLLDMLGQLHGTTKEADEELKAFVEAFKGELQAFIYFFRIIEVEGATLYFFLRRSRWKKDTSMSHRPWILWPRRFSVCLR